MGRCVRGFLDLEGLDRALVLAAQAFTALLPLLMVVASLGPAGQRGGVADGMINRFGLEGEAADAVSALFARPDSATGSVTLASLVLLLFSALSFTKRLQRMYQQAWGLPRIGVRGSVDAALGLGALLVELALLYLGRSLVRGLPADRAFELPLTLTLGVLLWTSIPWLLLHRRVYWRRLLPVGILASAAMSLYGMATSIYMPHLIESYSSRYGVFGVTIAIVGWLLAIAVILVASTVVGAEIDRSREPWARALRRRLRAEPVASDDAV